MPDIIALGPHFNLIINLILGALGLTIIILIPLAIIELIIATGNLKIINQARHRLMLAGGLFVLIIVISIITKVTKTEVSKQTGQVIKVNGCTLATKGRLCQQRQQKGLAKCSGEEADITSSIDACR